MEISKEEAKKAVLQTFESSWMKGDAEFTFKIVNDGGIRRWRIDERFTKRGKESL